MKKQVTPVLFNMSEILNNQQHNIENVPTAIVDFAKYISTIATKNITPSGMINLIYGALYDLRMEREKLPKHILKNRIAIMMCMRYFPLVVDKIASEDFSMQFRNLFVESFGEAA